MWAGGGLPRGSLYKKAAEGELRPCKKQFHAVIISEEWNIKMVSMNSQSHHICFKIDIYFSNLQIKFHFSMQHKLIPRKKGNFDKDY